MSDEHDNRCEAYGGDFFSRCNCFGRGLAREREGRKREIERLSTALAAERATTARLRAVVERIAALDPREVVAMGPMRELHRVVTEARAVLTAGLKREDGDG